LEDEVEVLKRQLGQGSNSILAPIYSLPQPYVLRKKIQVLVLPDNGSFIASLVDANINASGETVPEAVANLKDLMVTLYDLLSTLPKEKLGKWPTRQLNVLRLLVRKTQHATHQQRARNKYREKIEGRY
jgi:hypothetical protein